MASQDEKSAEQTGQEVKIEDLDPVDSEQEDVKGGGGMMSVLNTS